MTSMNESTTDGNTKGTAMTATLTWARDAETGEYSTLTRDHRVRKIELKIAKDPENSKSWMISNLFLLGSIGPSIGSVICSKTSNFTSLSPN